MEEPNREADYQDDEARAAHAVTEISGARHLLNALRTRLGHSHPELEEALTKLEVALSALTVNTGGML
jgi:hypothetical protein